ncbi:oligosaccharide flippase family protein [Patescibacteria group bacterium]|nr:oligosaccharide flippase family protein [Patescibacteria group bacterium]
MVMIIGSNFANFIAYIYHLVLGRLLGPAQYGNLAAILSVLGMFSTAFVFMSLVIVKFVSAAKKSELPALLSWFSKKAVLIGAIVSVLLLILTPYLSSFLHMDPKVIIFVGPVLFFFFLSLTYRSFLQGILRFKQVVLVTNGEFISRFLFGLVFVLIGLSVFGATIGIFLSSIVGYLISRKFLKEFRLGDGKGQFKGGKKILAYAAPIFLISLAKNSMFSTDVILVKHFFDSYDAGLYASLSTLGKIIFYGSGPISSVMFPIVSQRRSREKGYVGIFFISFLITAGIAGVVLLIYWLLPELAVGVLYGEEFLSAAPNLVWFGLFMAIFALSSLTVGFYLARGKTNIMFLIVLAAVGQAVGIWLFHDSILMVIKVSIVSVSFLLASLLIYFGYEFKIGRFKK